MRSVLRQEMAWFDTFGGGNFATLITEYDTCDLSTELKKCNLFKLIFVYLPSDLEKIKEGISEKIAMFAYLFASFCMCIVFPVFYGWKLALVVLSCTPLIILSTAFQAKVPVKFKYIVSQHSHLSLIQFPDSKCNVAKGAGRLFVCRCSSR